MRSMKKDMKYHCSEFIVAAVQEWTTNNNHTFGCILSTIKIAIDMLIGRFLKAMMVSENSVSSLGFKSKIFSKIEIASRALFTLIQFYVSFFCDNKCMKRSLSLKKTHHEQT